MTVVVRAASGLPAAEGADGAAWRVEALARRGPTTARRRLSRTRPALSRAGGRLRRAGRRRRGGARGGGAGAAHGARGGGRARGGGHGHQRLRLCEAVLGPSGQQGFAAALDRLKRGKKRNVEFLRAESRHLRLDSEALDFPGPRGEAAGERPRGRGRGGKAPFEPRRGRLWFRIGGLRASDADKGAETAAMVGEGGAASVYLALRRSTPRAPRRSARPRCGSAATAATRTSRGLPAADGAGRGPRGRRGRGRGGRVARRVESRGRRDARRRGAGRWRSSRPAGGRRPAARPWR